MTKLLLYGTILQTLFFTVLTAKEGKAQRESVHKIQVSVAWDNVTLSQAFWDLEQKTPFKFTYHHNKVDDKVTINFNAANTSLGKVLMFISENARLRFQRINENIHVGRKSKRDEALTEKFSEQLLLEKEISGRVTDENEEGLPGVNILVKDTNIGTVTDAEGNYKLIAPDNATTLVFAYVGYITEEVEIGSQTVINIGLSPDISTLAEVVVVGYGTEIKRNLTSSVATADVDDIDEIPNTSLSNAIAGRVPGVSITTAGGRPGTTSSITIRGASTGGFAGSTDPLYVIDNVIATKELFDLLDPNEVSEISILKDAAAAAIYGSRASNGVVLVTTKSGQKGAPKVQFTATVGSSEEAIRTEHLTAYEHALLVNQAVAAGNNPEENIEQSLFGNVPISDAELEYLRNGDFGNFEEQSRKAPVVQRYALNVSGGTENVTYFLAGSFVEESGNVEKLNYDKFNLRGKVDVNITDDLSLSLNTDLARDNDFQYFWPFDSDDALVDSYRQGTRRGNWAPAFINGLPVANFNAFNVSGFFDQATGGDRERTTDVANFTATLNYDIPVIEGLSVGATFNRRRVSNLNNTLRTPVVDYFFEADPNNRFRLLPNVVGTRERLFGGANGNSIERTTQVDNSYQLNFRVGYNKTFDDHKISAQFIYEQFEFERDDIFSRRRNPLSTNIRQLFATSQDAEDIFTTGSQAENGRLSYIGTLGYTFRDRYLVNGSFRYDGSTQFRPGKRYGFFPSASVGWIISEENFFQNVGFVDFLKLRASYGLTGSDNIDGGDNLLSSFSYLEGFRTSGSVVFGEGNANNNVIRSRGLAATELTWDKTTTLNLAVDFEVVNSKVSGTIEYFQNKRTDLFGPRNSITPVIIGASLPRENYGEVDVTGFDLLLNYQDNFGDLGVDIGFNLGYAKDKVITVDESEDLRPFQVQAGNNTGRIFGYKTKGIISTQEQLAQLIAAGFTQFNRDPYLGQLLFEDVRGNTVDDPLGNTPDGVVDANDRTLIADFDRPPVNYGANIQLKYKGFSLDVFIQGFAGHKKLVPNSGRFAFDVSEEGAWKHWTDAFDPVENPDGKFPRWVNFWSMAASTNLETSEFWLRNGGFARVKNVNFAYSLPRDIAERVGLGSVKFFVNGSNLFFLYKDTENFDPELGGDGVPIYRNYSGGVQITL